MTARVTPMAALALIVGLAAGPALAGEPTEVMRERIDRVVKALESDRSHARQSIEQVAEETFDFTEMARRALGPHWRERSPEERTEFTRLFREVLEDAYVGRIERYEGEKIVFAGESVDGPQATVKSRVITRTGTEIPVDYRLHRVDGRWRVYDVVIEGVSLVANYRTQFNRIIQSGSYQDLVERMRRRALGPADGGRRPRG
ncbi:MAG: ABC transporter substrate-binding protein [Candidatus Rokubacteria bacterium]|nr:ABC transporter substrate-binding protein [Candidatus Rokubacteria bacterium]